MEEEEGGGGGAPWGEGGVMLCYSSDVPADPFYNAAGIRSEQWAIKGSV